jgi:pimeloyl-ACP methyl ester carboxylesterase
VDIGMKTIVANGVSWGVVDRGVGSPIVLVHGFPLDHRMWEAQIDALSATHRVIAPDLRGFGASGGVSDSNGTSSDDSVTVTMAHMADDLAAMLDALGVRDPVAVCGLSMGGYVAWEFWRRHGRRVGRLIQCDTRAAADGREAARARLLAAERVVQEGMTPLAEQMMPRLLPADAARRCPGVVESVRRMIDESRPAAVAAALRGMAVRTDFTPLLAEIDVPTLFLVGELDAISPVEEMRSMAAAVPGARLVVVRSAGHISPMEDPAAVSAAILEFLRATESETAIRS